MRYYKKIIERKVNSIIDSSRETRDAVVWDIFDGYCRVKIQGSDKFINAHFPENLDMTPSWIKPGNAVKIQHTGGERGRIEIIGHSNIIPTNTPPANIVPADNRVVSGCALRAGSQYTQLKIGVGVGNYSINNTNYRLSPIVMSEDNLFILGDGNFIDALATFIQVSPCTKSRYDVIVVGTDEKPKIISGEESDTNPIMPSIPANTISLGWILLYPGIVKIAKTDLNTYFYQQDVLYFLDVVIGDTDILWTDPVTTTISVSVLNSRGDVVNGDYYITASIQSGNGYLTSLEDGNGSFVGQHSYNGVTTFTYTRNHTAGDVSPVIKFTLVSKQITKQSTIFLRDSNGDIMI